MKYIMAPLSNNKFSIPAEKPRSKENSFKYPNPIKNSLKFINEISSKAA